MTECKYKKRLQIYLDGWMDRGDSERFEGHLRKCRICQVALMEIEEISSSALEIIDHAPDRDYWENFFNRVHNRIVSRDLSPYEQKKEWHFHRKLVSYSFGFVAIAAVFVLAFGLLTRSSRDLPQATSVNEITVPSVQFPENESPAAPAVENQEIASGAQTVVRSPNRKDVEVEPAAPVVVAEADTNPVEDDEQGGPETVAALDLMTVFRDSPQIVPARLQLERENNSLARLLAENGGTISGDSRISPEEAAEGIIADYASSGEGPRINGQNGFQVNGSSGRAADPVNPKWGYLGLPADTVRTDEFRRYLIELDLMLVK